jgi:BioD-like phosphotransacetylase family protein
MVISIAKSKGVPVVVTSLNTFSAVKRIQSLVGRDMLKDRGKALRAKEVVAKEFDLDKFLAMLEV